MPTLNQTRNAIDNWVSNRWSTVVARQDAHLASHGHYWQGKPTHLTLPAWSNQADGSKVGDRLGESPSDQPRTWLDVLPEWLTELFPACLRVDVYDGPLGKGWTVTADVTHNGNHWRRVVNVGPETWRASGWTQAVA